MILERLCVAGFRTFANPIAFTPDARFTVIHAPNGTGKSTLLDALYFGLLERHSVSGDSAKARFKSIGRDLTPTIEVDFAVDNVHYRLRKVFFGSGKSASLQRLESGRYVALKDGSLADDFVRDLFSAEAPGRGAIEPSKHLGFAHVLWSPARASFARVPEIAGDQIRAMLGGAALAVTDGERAVQERVTARYRHFFTDEGGYTSRVGSANIPALEVRLHEAREVEAEARRQHLRLERLGIDYADREAEAERMSAVRTGLRSEIEAMKRSVHDYTALKTATERAARTEAETRLPYERITSVVQKVVALRTEREVIERSRTECSSEVEKLNAAATRAYERFNRARKAFEDAGAFGAEIQTRAAGVTAARSYLDSCQSVERLQSILAAYDISATNLAAFSAARAVITAPVRAELESLRAAAAEANALQTTIAASALSLEIEAESAITVEVIAGGTTGALPLAPGSTTKIAAADEAIIIDVPGLGRIRARGTDGAAKARKKLQLRIAQLDAARERFGTSSIAELALRTERSEELQRNVVQTESLIKQLLENRSVDAVRASLAEGLARVGSIEADHPAWRTDRPDAPALRADFDRDLQRANDASAVARIELAAAEQLKNEVDAKTSVLRTRDAGLAILLESNATQLRLLEDDGLSDVTRADQVHALALTWSAAKAAQVDIAEKLARFIDDPQAALDRLADAEHDAGAAYERALGEARMYRAQLDMQTNSGSYAVLASAEERVAQYELDLAALQTQAAAIECLYRAIDRIRAARIASIVGPITSASTRYLTRIVGSPMGTIDISEALTPSGLIESASGLKLSIDGTLSTGEREQIYLATRLALAEIIAKQRGRQLFVVDDALTATDPSRLRRFVAILEELSRERLQVIVTTADQSRYLGIAGAKHIDLATALLGQSAA